MIYDMYNLYMFYVQEHEDLMSASRTSVFIN